MITFIVHADIKPGATDRFQDAVYRTTRFIAEHEPDFASYVHYDLDASQAFFVNVVSDSDALALHFALAPDNEAHPEMMSACDVTSVQICGDLAPEVEQLVAAMNPQRLTFHDGTFGRRVQPA